MQKDLTTSLDALQTQMYKGIEGSEVCARYLTYTSLQKPPYRIFLSRGGLLLNNARVLISRGTLFHNKGRLFFSRGGLLEMRLYRGKDKAVLQITVITV